MGSSPTRGSSIFLGKVTALGVLCCFALFVCLTLLASFFLPSHLSFKNMYIHFYILSTLVVSLHYLFLCLLFVVCLLFVSTVPGVLEYESIPNISSVRPILGCHTSSHDPNITITTVTRELSAILEVLRKHCLSQETIADLMRQTFFMINGFLLNNLLLRRDMCHWSKGLQIR